MTDNLTPEKRKKVMCSIKSKNSKPELILWSVLDHRSFRRYPKITGRPDIGCQKRKIAIFVDGCFWHGCPNCYKPPTTRASYWAEKLERNTTNDRKVNELLGRKGFKVLRFWEHQIIEDIDSCLKDIREAIN